MVERVRRYGGRRRTWASRGFVVCDFEEEKSGMGIMIVTTRRMSFHGYVSVATGVFEPSGETEPRPSRLPSSRRVW